MSKWELVAGVLMVGAFLACYLTSLRWLHADAEARGKDGITIAMLVGIFMWPTGILVWLAMRPPKRHGDALAPVRGGLPKQPCIQCKKLISQSWRACPYCGNPH